MSGKKIINQQKKFGHGKSKKNICLNLIARHNKWSMKTKRESF